MRTRHTLRPPARGGFTLVELLVVISLIAILLALSAGAFFRIQAGQNVSTAEATLTKLHSLMDSKYKITLDDARKTVPQDLITALGDKDRAQVVWTYAKLKNEMPMTFGELTTVSLPPGTPATTLKPRSVHLKVQAQFGGADFIRQSAALFYASIIETASGGTMTNLEGLQQQVKTDANGMTYFVDAWGQPIAFVRHATNQETNSDAVAKPRQVKPYPATFPMRSSLDPNGRMTTQLDANEMTGIGITPQYNPWLLLPPAYTTNNDINIGVSNYIQDQLNTGLFFIVPGSPPQKKQSKYCMSFANINRLPTLVSGGPNKDFDPLESPGRFTAAVPDFNIADTFGSNGGDDDCLDNLLSYRLRTVGARGN